MVEKAEQRWMRRCSPDHMRRAVGRVLWAVIRATLLFSIAVIILYPLIYMLSMSLRPKEQIWDPTVVWIPKSLTFENIRITMQDIEYPRVLLTTVFLTGISSALSVASCSLAGYGFARFRFRFKELLFMMVIFTILVPPQTIIYPSFIGYWKFDFLGLGYLAAPFLDGEPFTINLVNTPFTLFIPALLGSGIRSGLFIYIFRQHYRGLPKEMEDAANIDGCGTLGTFMRIAIPSSRLTIVTVFLFSTVWFWNDYYFTNIYMGNVKTLTSAVAALPSKLHGLALMGAVHDSYDIAQISTMIMAACLLLIAPLVLLFALLQKYFVEGVEVSGLVE